MAGEHDHHSALERLVREGSDADLRRFLLILQPPELADLLEALKNSDDRTRAFRAIVGPNQAEVMRGMEDQERTEVLEDLTEQETAALVRELQSDDAVDVLQDLPEDVQERVLKQIEPEDRAELREILTYPEDSAGGIMQTELVAVREGWTARQAVEEIRRTRDEVGELHEIFVVDDEDHLRGWLSERALILAEDETPIHGLIGRVPVQAGVHLDQEEIASLVQDYDVSSVPVVDDAGRLVGRILVDDIVDVLVEEATEDILRQGGTDPEEIYEAGVLTAIRARAPWLFITFLGGIAAAQIIMAGDGIIHKAQVASLFAFIPVIMGMGGGSSTQAATVTVRSLALGRIGAGEVWGVVRKEFVSAFVLSAFFAVLLLVVSGLTASSGDVGLICSTALFGTMCLGTLLGVVTPLMLNKLGADPAVATSPFVTTMNDIIGSSVIIFFTWWLLL